MPRPSMTKETIHSRVDVQGQCWLWRGNKTRDGYGVVILHGKRTTAHRASYTLFHGEIHSGLWVLHSCDTPACVNPDHLRLGTAKDNIHDAIARERNTRLLSGQRAFIRGMVANHLCRGGVRQLRETFGLSKTYFNTLFTKGKAS